MIDIIVVSVINMIHAILHRAPLESQCTLQGEPLV